MIEHFVGEKCERNLVSLNNNNNNVSENQSFCCLAEKCFDLFGERVRQLLLVFWCVDKFSFVVFIQYFSHIDLCRSRSDVQRKFQIKVLYRQMLLLRRPCSEQIFSPVYLSRNRRNRIVCWPLQRGKKFSKFQLVQCRLCHWQMVSY